MSPRVLNGGVRLLRIAVIALPLGYGAWLVWSERAFRQALPTVPAVSAASPPTAEQRPSVNYDAIVSVMGLAALSAQARSVEPLTLKASFVSISAPSRALLGGADGQRSYRVGDSLPGGSVLRRVESGRVVLWRNGREEFLSLEVPGDSLFREVKVPASPVSPITPHLLRVSP